MTVSCGCAVRTIARMAAVLLGIVRAAQSPRHARGCGAQSARRFLLANTCLRGPEKSPHAGPQVTSVLWGGRDADARAFRGSAPRPEAHLRIRQRNHAELRATLGTRPVDCTRIGG